MIKNFILPPGSDLKEYFDEFKKCSDFPEPKKKKHVWQWRYFEEDTNRLAVCSYLMTEDEAKHHFSWQHRGNNRPYEKHAGPFEVDE